MKELAVLHQKVAEFEGRLREDIQALSHCRQSCSRCCYVDLSIFEVEADHIRNWFAGLPEEKKESIKQSWSIPLTKQVNFQGVEVSSCSFLRNESCTIYEARPLICRTQGLPLKYREEGEDFVDICPLNEGMLESVTEGEILNLDTLNAILARLEVFGGKNARRERVGLTSLRDELRNG